MAIEYQTTSQRRICRGRLFVILLCSVVASAVALPVCHQARYCFNRLVALRAQSQCLAFDAHGAIVYSEKCHRLWPRPVKLGTGRVKITPSGDPADIRIPDEPRDDFYYSKSSPSPDCWRRLKPYFPIDNLDDLFLIAQGYEAGPIIALHECLVGTDRRLLILHIDLDHGKYIGKSAYLITPATYSKNPDMVQCDISDVETTDEYVKKYGIYDWESLVVHAAVVDPGDQQHFTVEMDIDSHPIFYDYHLLVAPDGKPWLMIKPRR
jgi:hypothetical protein